MFEHKIINVRGPVELGTVTVYPVLPKRGVVKIVYNGLLPNSGAQDIYMRTGYGNSSKWQEIYDYPMSRIPEGWEQTIHLKRNNYFHFCFKDGADHWDNRSGQNWILDTEGF